MRTGNPALDEMLRKQQIKRCEELRRAHELGQPMQTPAPSRAPLLIDKMLLVYRTTRIIRTMKKSSWKTTVGGLLIAAGQAVPADDRRKAVKHPNIAEQFDGKVFKFVGDDRQCCAGARQLVERIDQPRKGRTVAA